MEIRQQRLYLGQRSARELVETFGSPLYVYEAATMARQYRRLTGAFAGVPLAIKYACKANSNPAVIGFIHGLGAGIDAASIFEVEIARRCGVPAAEIIFTPNCPPFAEIERAIEIGVTINADSIATLERFAQAYGAHPVSIRINPHIVAGGNAHLQTGHIDSKFGISIHQMRHVLRIVKAYGMRIAGLHMHTGSEILDVGTFLTGAEILIEHAEAFPDLEFLDFGSGFKVAYKTDDVATDIEALGTAMTERFRRFCDQRGAALALWFEPGKFLVSEAGVFLATVTTLKQTPSCVFVGTDTGLNHLIRPMLYDSYHGILNADRGGGIERVYTVVGNICETDTFATDRRLPEVREGDILAFLNAGAYGYAMASNYNSRPRPAEVLIGEDGEPRLVRRRETLEDMLAATIF